MCAYMDDTVLCGIGVLDVPSWYGSELCLVCQETWRIV